MKKFKGVIIALVVVVIVVISASLFFYDMGVDNKEISFRERFKAQEKICMTSHDEMWKVIKQDANVTDKYYEDFEAIFPQIANGMLSDEAMFQWMAGFNPEYSTELYAILMKTIKDERTKFKRAQDICVDVSREYVTYVKKKPTTWFIDNEILDAQDYISLSKDAIKLLKGDGTFANSSIDPITLEALDIFTYQPVTSTKTESVFELGVDDDIELFTEKETTEKNQKLVDSLNTVTASMTAEEKEAKMKEFNDFMKNNPELFEKMNQ